MVRYVSETQAQTLDHVRNFDAEGYKLVAKESDDTTLVFDRPKQEPPTKKAAAKKSTPASEGKTKKRTATADKKAAEPKKKGRKAKSK